MNTTIRNLALLAAGFAVCAAASTGQKQTPPEGAPAKAFTVPAHETYTLTNGLKVTLVPYGKIPKVTLSVAVDAGSIDEGASHVGVASMTGDLLNEGTATLSSAQLAEAVARMGSTLNVGVSNDQTTIDLDVLSEFGPDAARLLAEVLQHPRLPESELARLKNDRLRQIAVNTSRAQTIAQMRFMKIVYVDHPYSIVVPSEADVKKIAISRMCGRITSPQTSTRSVRTSTWLASSMRPRLRRRLRRASQVGPRERSHAPPTHLQRPRTAFSISPTGPERRNRR